MKRVEYAALSEVNKVKRRSSSKNASNMLDWLMMSGYYAGWQNLSSRCGYSERETVWRNSFLPTYYHGIMIMACKGFGKLHWILHLVCPLLPIAVVAMGEPNWWLSANFFHSFLALLSWLSLFTSQNIREQEELEKSCIQSSIWFTHCSQSQ